MSAQRLEPAFLPVPGVRLGSAAAGIRYRGRDDLVVLALAEGSTAAAVFTRNAFCAAPVTVAKRHLAAGKPRYLLINAGNANAGTGARGLADARACCQRLAAAVGCRPEQVVPFSTGVIGEYLPLDNFAMALPATLSSLGEREWPRAARAIMTTDTVPKLVSREVRVGTFSGAVTGMAKGAGMIRPDMATMLAFLATDFAVAPALLQGLLHAAVAPSFNAITIDGDTSTNDACILVATGASAAPPLERQDQPLFAALSAAVTEVCMELAAAIVRDGEGATKLVSIEVGGGGDREEAVRLAYTIAHSPLVKTALFAGDPNWGRILAAVGRAGIPRLDIGKVEILLDDVCIVRHGERAGEYREVAGRAVMARDEFAIRVNLGRGTALARVLTCDLSYDYVRINAEYRT